MDRLVYGLVDPRNNKCYYVGMSRKGIKRPLNHLIKSSNKEVAKWVGELRKIGLCPQIQIFERVNNDEELAQRETEYIKMQSLINKDLLNIQHNISEKYTRSTTDTDDEFNNLIEAVDNVHKILSRERKFRSLTQQQLSDKASISRSTLSLLERGSNVSMTVVKSVVDVLTNHSKKDNSVNGVRVSLNEKESDW